MNSIEELGRLATSFAQAEETQEKLTLLQDIPLEIDFELPEEDQFLVKAIHAIGQGEILFQGVSKSEELEAILAKLRPVEAFYRSIGGIVGYHLAFLKLLQKQVKNGVLGSILSPPSVDITQDSRQVRQAILWGIDSLPKLAEIYPVGGAGDRLDLVDEETGESLPAAQLQFCGHTLLEHLIRDLQGREYLHEKLRGERVVTPVVMMVSEEKENARYIRQICEDNDWFGRGEDSFFFFVQPLVPMITEKGMWAVSRDGELLMKPGGHGVMWKAAIDAGAFDWLTTQGRHKALVRQINNPIAGLDSGLLAFSGIGMHGDKSFGFASCRRLLNTAEGVNVLIEREKESGFEYALTNIEYTEFSEKGIEDVPETPESPYSAFPSNTNILFADLDVVKESIAQDPIPGRIINMKNTVSCRDAEGNEQKVKGGRLEAMMQNIADTMTETFAERLNSEDANCLGVFLTHNRRLKTISTTKKKYRPGQPLVETPEGAHYDLLKNMRELFVDHCRFEIPEMCSEKAYVEKGPSFLINIHPSLGPLYTVIGQKIRSGSLAEGAELTLEVGEVDIEGLQLEGSLKIEASDLFGGRCLLRNVTVKNQGIDREAENNFAQHNITHQELLHVILHGNAELVAEDILFEGPYRIEVPDGHRLTVENKEGELKFRTESIDTPSWRWEYSVDENLAIKLEKTILL